VENIPWDRLFEAATAARERAYAPYSKFKVGSAVLFENGVIYPGCNTENSSYSLTVCAERAAIFRAVVEGQHKLLACAVVAAAELPCPPCGSCRQVMAEFGTTETMVGFRSAESGQEERYTLQELLPHAFTKAFLKPGR
jgi:cytidine deaminase